MIKTEANFGELRPAIEELTDLGVKLPETSRKALEAIAVLDDGARFASIVPSGLADLTAEQLIAATDARAFARGLEVDRANARGEFRQALASELREDLRDNLDQVLDQLRPAFAKAAAGVVAAHKSGLRADQSDAAILHLGHQALDAWKAMPDAIATLDAIGGARLRLARAIQRVPAQDQQAGAFCSASGAWHPQTPRNRWLALVEHGLQLNTAEETRLACRRPTPPPAAPSSPDWDENVLAARLGRAVV